MEVREFWNGREIKGDDPELREHQSELVQNFFNKLYRADKSEAMKLFRPVAKSDEEIGSGEHPTR